MSSRGFPKQDAFIIYEEGDMTLLATGMGGGIRDNVVVVQLDRAGKVDLELIALSGPNPSALGTLRDYVLPGDIFEVGSRYFERLTTWQSIFWTGTSGAR